MVFAILICNETYSKHETPELCDKFYKEVSGAILENAGNEDPSDDDTKDMVEQVKMFFQINEGLIWRTQLSDGKTRGVSKTDALNKLTAPLSEKLTRRGSRSALRRPHEYGHDRCVIGMGMWVRALSKYLVHGFSWGIHNLFREYAI